MELNIYVCQWAAEGHSSNYAVKRELSLLRGHKPNFISCAKCHKNTSYFLNAERQGLEA